MSETHKDIDELLSCYIDDELSDRERTEVKRLIRHDKSIAGRLGRLQKQKQLLNSLPTVAAPEGLLEDIKTSLKPKPILARYLTDDNKSAGARHLLFRRVLTAAAVFMLVGALALVVFNVMMPGTETRRPMAAKPAARPQDADPVTEAIVASAADKPAPTPVSFLFRAALELATEDSIAVNGFIAKAIYRNGLVDNTIPKRQATLSSYHLTCTTTQIVALLADLEAVWPKCRSTTLTLYEQADVSDIVVGNITSAQTIAVFGQDKPDERTELAQNFADFNAIIRDGADYRTFALSRPEERFVPSIPIKPELTRPEQPPLRRDQPQTGGSVNLIITVTGL
jgi:hypothetical protein